MTAMREVTAINCAGSDLEAKESSLFSGWEECIDAGRKRDCGMWLQPGGTRSATYR